MPPYPKLLRMYESTCVPILVLLEQFEQLVSYFLLCRWTIVGIQNTQIPFVIPPVVRHDFHRTTVNSQFFVKLYHNVDHGIVGPWQGKEGEEFHYSKVLINTCMYINHSTEYSCVVAITEPGWSSIMNVIIHADCKIILKYHTCTHNLYARLG